MPRLIEELSKDPPTSSIELGRRGNLIEERTRQTFKNTPQFTLTMMSAMIDAGNFARFPYTAYHNGQGAFIIAYFVSLFVIARPLLTMEMYLGQFSSRGNIKSFRSLGHLYSGIGFSQTFVTFLMMSYAGPAVAITLFYFSQSFHYELPWAYCKPEWGEGCHNETNSNGTNFTSSAKYYFRRIVLHENREFSYLEAPRWDICVALVCAWILAFLVLSAGVGSLIKVNYFLGMFPMAMISIMLVETCHLEGSFKGIKTMLTPKWRTLLSLDMWYHALCHTLTSVGIGVGTNLMYASYNPIDTNLKSVAWFLCSMDFIGSLMAAATLYAAMGHLASDMQSDVNAVMTTGHELWVLYSSAVINLGTPYVLSVIFFFMFVALGLGTLVSYQQLITTQYTDFDRESFNDWHLSALTAILGFGIGLIYITPQGRIITNFTDTITVCMSAEIISWVLAASISYGYGLRNFCCDIKFMTTTYPGLGHRIVWRISPFVIFICTALFSETPKKIQKVSDQIGDSKCVVGWFLIVLVISPIVLIPLVEIISKKTMGLKKTFELMVSNEQWEPIAEKFIYKRYIFEKEDELLERSDEDRKWLMIWNNFIAKEKP